MSSISPVQEVSDMSEVVMGDSCRPLKVCLLISSLEFGGAERQVIEMTKVIDRSKVDPMIISLSDEVPLTENNPEAKKVLHIIKKHGKFDFTTVLRAARLMRDEKVDVVHAFMFDSEMVARLAAPIAGVKVVIASERNSDYVRPKVHHWAQVITKPLFDVMVANSNAGARLNMDTLNLESSKLRVVHNGVDTERFQPDPGAGQNFRKRHGIPMNAKVVGMVGSFKRQKDHEVFLRMAAEILQTHADCWFLIAGDVVSGREDSTVYAAEIRELATELNLDERCLFVGNQLDVASFYNACDFTALLSLREGTPNVALESMACGKPVVATDVADNSIIIIDGKTGFIVPSRDWSGAANCAKKILDSEGLNDRMADQARRHVTKNYTPARAAEKLSTIYSECYEKRG